MAKTTIQELAESGQSIWLDNINRSMIQSGVLKEMIGRGLLGMTSNPTIFDKAVSSSSDYDKKIEGLSKSGKTTFQIYDDLTIEDVQDAADIFRPVYERSSRLDGYVSLEINPKLAMMTEETIEEGKRLYRKVNRPNVMLKVPSTDAGFKAIEELLAEGININITLIFSLAQYIKTAQAFLKGMNRLSKKEGDLSKTSSVASVFVSRIDTAVDKMLDEKMAEEKDEAIRQSLSSLKGKAAVADSKLIFRKYMEIFCGKEFRSLKENGAHIQRVLWGSTSTKNPAYSDIKYVTELIGKDTVNTIPEATFEAFLDHGKAKEVLTADDKDAQAVINELKGFGIDIDVVCAKLLQDGVAAFESSFESLLNTIEKKAKKVV